MNYFVNKDGLERGPYNEVQLRKMVASGLLSPEDTALSENGMAPCAIRTLWTNSPPPNTGSPGPLVGDSEAPDADENFLANLGIQSVPVIPGQNVPYGHAPRPPRQPLTGVGGWLLVFGLFVTIIAPAVDFFVVPATYANENVRSSMRKYPQLQVLTLVQFATMVALIALDVAVGLVLLFGNPRRKVVAQGYLIVHLCLRVAFDAVFVLILDGVLTNGFGNLLLTAGIKCALEFVFFSVWWLYFQKSIRVKNTYDLPAE